MFSLETTIAGHTLIHKATGSKCLCISQDKERAVICPSPIMQETDKNWAGFEEFPGTGIAVSLTYEEVDRQFESIFAL